MAECWDIFCRVVDNYGDAGVAFRLARALAREHGKRVRLRLDDPAVLSRLRPDFAGGLLDGVEVVRWEADWAEAAPVEAAEVADVVVETFGCDTPAGYVEAMAARSPMPRWINLEYLSAEDWVEGSHALPSPPPRFAPLTRHFFFPGFTAKTGGLLRERGLLDRRDALQSDRVALEGAWRRFGVEPPPPDALCVSLFAYPGAPFASLLDALAARRDPAWVVAPEGPASEALSAWLPAGGRERGAVRGFPVPFLPQDAYDELLWACHVNFVRGEDSFVRAQWAARPFAWHIYPQAEGAHWVKLGAFLSRYTASLGRDEAAAVTGLWDCWNRGEALAAAWPAFEAALPRLAAPAREWARGLARRADLASALADFADNVLK